VSLILAPTVAVMLAQAPAVVGTVPQPNPELDAAYTCLTTGAERLLAEGRPRPDEQARWGWAVEIARVCEARIDAAANSEGSVYVLGDHAHSSISKRDLLRAEATYFVDRLIREHYEAQS